MTRKILTASAILAGVMLLCVSLAWAGPTKVEGLRTFIGEVPEFYSYLDELLGS